jgi:hypothetical protein
MLLANFNVGKDAKTVNVHLKLSLRAGVKNKSLKQSKGTGASGSFKIGEVVKPKKKPALLAAGFFLGLTTSPILNDPEAPVPFDCFKLLFLTPALSESLR